MSAASRDTEAEAGSGLRLAAGLDWLDPLLDHLLATVRGHATLLHGAPGDGTHDLAWRLGQAWLCEDRHPGVRRPCGVCGSCRLFRQATHPDLHALLPEERALERGWPVEIKAGRKPSRQIRVDDVRAVIDGLSRTSGRGVGKVLVILPAEAMNAVAASALLKTLEEPPAGTRIVLAAAEPARLLPTILSRCQQVRVPTPPAEQALRWLAGQGVDQAAVLLQAAGGHPLEALALQASGIAAARWLSLPRQLAEGDPAALAGWAPPAMLEALGKLCHDAMALAAGGGPRFFAQAEWPGGLELRRLLSWQRSLQAFARHAEHPWNEALLADALAREAHEALRAPRRAASGPGAPA
jgi:DNA polymerase-3 subunit delta'